MSGLSLSVLSAVCLGLLLIILVASLRDRKWLRYAFFMRVPIAGIGALVIVPVVAPALSELANLLVMEWDGFLALSFFALLSAWACGFTAEIIFRLAEERFDVPRPRVPAWLEAVDRRLSRLLPSWLERSSGGTRPMESVGLHHIVWSSLATLPLFVVGLWLSVKVHASDHLWLGLLGYLGATSLGLLAALAALAIILGLRRFLLKHGVMKIVAAFWNPLLRHAGFRKGYVYRAADGQIRYLPGHALATVLSLISTALYVGVLLFSRPTNDPEQQLFSFHYILIFITLVVTVLSGVTFFLDRFRVPVMSAFVLLIVGLGGLRSLDYRFDLWRPDSPPPREMPHRLRDFLPATPAEVVEPLLNGLAEPGMGSQPILVVVSAAGGGIQAAAWTAIVLTGLQEEIGPDFARSIRLISAVSGGSVGAMYYVGAFSHGNPPPADSLEEVFLAASHPSLQATVWAMFFHDLPRLVWPFNPPVRDRAWAMERSWEQAWRAMTRRTHLDSSDDSEAAPPRLSHWIADVKKGRRPALVMNALLASSGKRLLIGSGQVPTTGEDSLNFEDYCCGGGDKEPADIDLITAARVSATFPYITPMARAEWDDGQDTQPYELPGERLADGGYYDNFGVLTATDWLAAVVDSAARGFKQVVLIRIEPFPERDEKVQEDTVPGLVSETLGPLLALLEARERMQRSRNDRELRELSDKLNPEEGDPHFRALTVRPPRMRRPTNVLSWHLSPAEKDNLLKAWDAVRDSPEVRELKELFRGAS
jgi:hypothetical protein